ncbi:MULTISPECIES: hypothetical protein [Streptomyces]|uniref:hypothetical protein n=1 Tax=Streptomyces TaxID=1883 RepID=UPI001319CF98|nr:MULTISPECIES: hypothetical protein [Streptomyces]MYT09116.1 hypothetical protein [Streptomyces sp. SID5470]
MRSAESSSSAPSRSVIAGTSSWAGRFGATRPAMPSWCAVVQGPQASDRAGSPRAARYAASPSRKPLAAA